MRSASLSPPVLLLVIALLAPVGAGAGEAHLASAGAAPAPGAFAGDPRPVEGAGAVEAAPPAEANGDAHAGARDEASPMDAHRSAAVDAEAMEEALHPAAEPAYASPNAYHHYLRAKLAEAGGDLESALEELRMAIAFDGESAELHLAIGWIQARQGRLDAAAHAAERALRLDPARWEGHLLLGKVRVEQRSKRAAAASLRRAVGLAAAEPGGRERLERFLARFGDPRLQAAIESRMEEATAAAGARAERGR
ncbi:MAG TPA: tetratricopeptide repeat protein [Vulgatibacter sp.]|nr:tetratricopeptide repeat protein [Vulgatibacter sp.]